MLTGGQNYAECNEKRDFYRMTLNAPLTFNLSGENKTCNGFCRNLSHTGLQFFTEHPALKGMHLEITIDTRHSRFEPLRARVEVVRSEAADDKYIIAGKILEYN